MPVLLPSMGIAVALQYTNGPADNDFLINLLNALFVVGCFGAGIWAAKRKRYAEHKDWVLLGLVISMQNGLSRVGMYLMQTSRNAGAAVAAASFNDGAEAFGNVLEPQSDDPKTPPKALEGEARSAQLTKAQKANSKP